MQAKQLWVYLEQEQDAITGESRDLLALAQKLAEAGGYLLRALICGPQAETAAGQAARWRLDALYCTQHSQLDPAQHPHLAATLAPLLREQQPEIVLFPSSKTASTLAAILGVRLQSGVIAHCADLRINEDGLLVGLIPAYGGQLLGEILCPKARPQIATTRAPEAQPQAATQEAPILPLPVCLDEDCGLELLEQYEQAEQGLSLTEAALVVCGGRGLGSAENWRLLRQLAQRLGAAPACTRPPIDADWGADESMMIGTSGKTVRPKLYLGFGVSGTAHHTCGMRESGLILNVNTDPNAPVFLVSDQGYLADAGEVLRRLLELVS